MAITKIVEEIRTSNCDITVNDDGTYAGTAVREFVVSFDSGTAAAERQFIARDTTSAVGGVTIPAIWESHPYDQFIFVRRKSVKMWNGPFHWLVTCEYEEYPDPFNTPYTVDWLFASTNEPIDQGWDPNTGDEVALVNSSGEPWDPPINEEFSDLVLRITRNETSYDPLAASDFKHSVNSDLFLWFPAQTVKCSLFEGKRLRVADMYYYQVQYEFMIRYNLAELFQITGPLGWKRRILDQGFRTNVNGATALIKDSEGSPITTPKLLDGAGGELPDGSDPVYKVFRTKKTKAFASLGFNTTDEAFSMTIPGL